MQAPLTALECELLEAVIHDRDDALGVLGDYWIEHDNEARGAFLHLHLGANRDRIDLADEEVRLAPFTHAWRAPLLAAGYLERDLTLVDGFLQWPLSIPADHPLDGDPDIVRLSPRYYRELRLVRDGVEHAVYEAEAVTPRTRTRVAVKAASLDETHDILERELALLAELSHPNLPRVFGLAARPARSHQRRDTSLAVVFAWSGTDTLRLLRSARAANQTLGVPFAISVAVQLLDAIAAIDRAGITHLEVRPDHVMVAADGTVTLIDFGYARGLRPPPRNLISPGLRIDGFRFRYLSPQQVRGDALDHRTDVFSAAGLISELVANEHPLPFGANDFDTLALVSRHLQVASAELPDALRLPIQGALAMEAARRPTARALREELLDGARRIRMDIGPHVIAQRLVELGVPT